MKVELQTFASVFPHVSLWLVPPVTREGGAGLAADMLLVGSRETAGAGLGARWRRRSAARPAKTCGRRASCPTRPPSSRRGRWTARPAPLRERPGVPAGHAPQHRRLSRDRAPRAPSQRDGVGRGGGGRLVRSTTPWSPRPRSRRSSGSRRTRPASSGTRSASDTPRRRRPGAAVGALERAAAADPARDGAFELLGHLYLDRRDFPAAERVHRALLRLRPGNVEAWLRLGAVLARQSKWKEALDAMKRARQLDPGAPIDPDLKPTRSNKPRPGETRR